MTTKEKNQLIIEFTSAANPEKLVHCVQAIENYFNQETIEFKNITSQKKPNECRFSTEEPLEIEHIQGVSRALRQTQSNDKTTTIILPPKAHYNPETTHRIEIALN